MLLQLHRTTCIFLAPLCALHIHHIHNWPELGPGMRKDLLPVNSWSQQPQQWAYMGRSESLGPTSERQNLHIQATLQWLLSANHCWYKVATGTSPFWGGPTIEVFIRPWYLLNNSCKFPFPHVFYELISYEVTLTDQGRNYHLSSNPPGRALTLSESNNTSY